jgi:hypothetical protein
MKLERDPRQTSSGLQVTGTCLAGPVHKTASKLSHKHQALTCRSYLEKAAVVPLFSAQQYMCIISFPSLLLWITLQLRISIVIPNQSSVTVAVIEHVDHCQSLNCVGLCLITNALIRRADLLQRSG